MGTTKPEQVSEKVAQRLARIRKLQKLTQEDLQETTGISTFYISRIENGVRKPTLPTLAKLAKGLDISLEELFKGL